MGKCTTVNAVRGFDLEHGRLRFRGRLPALFYLIHPDVHPGRRRLVDGEIADDDVGSTVAVDVANVERGVSREAFLDRVPDEDSRFGLLQPDESRQCLLLYVRPTCQERARADVQV